jgi:hypothetical protein
LFVDSVRAAAVALQEPTVTSTTIAATTSTTVAQTIAPVTTTPAPATTKAPVTTRATAPPATDPPSNCDPNYSGCLNPNSPDYDCVGGSGNGPDYTGTVQVLGNDHFGLDADHDGTGCE